MPPAKRQRATELLTLSGGHAQPKRLIEYFRTGKLTDVVLEASDGTPFSAHRNILAASSDYLDGRMGADWRDSSGPVKLPTMSSAVLERLLDYVYVGETSLPESLLIPLLEAAHYLAVGPLLDAASKAIEVRLDSSNGELRRWP